MGGRPAATLWSMARTGPVPLSSQRMQTDVERSRSVGERQNWDHFGTGRLYDGKVRKPPSALGLALGAPFQRRVQRGKSPFRVGQHAAEQRNEKTAEGLLLAQPAVARFIFDDEGMLAVENARHQHAAEPAQLAVGLGDNNGGTERHRLVARRLDRHVQFSSDLGLAFNAS